MDKPKEKPKQNGNVYVVQKNDTLEKIARKNNTTVDDILSKNPKIKDKNKISIGQRIII